jgi:CheY-like chemotaxis protein
MTNKRILVIDDEQRIQEVVQACLEILSNWEVITVGSGAEGLNQAQNQKLDAILLDVSLPEMDGITIFQQLQAHPTTQAIPVLLLTAKVQPQDKEQFAQLGIAGVITKPFDPVQLPFQIAQVLGWNL